MLFFALRVLARMSGQMVSHLIRTGQWKTLPGYLLATVVGVPLALVGGYCAWHLERIPFSNRMHLVFLSRDDERFLSEVAFAGVMRREGRKLLPQKEELFLTARRVADQLLRVCKEQGALPESAEFKVNIIQSRIPNAFVLPDGSIFVYTGIIPICKTEAGLACVMGHEISHALARHSAEKIGFVKTAILIVEFIRGLGDHRRDWQSILIEFIVCTVLQLGLPLAHSRRMETEADRIGLKLAANAGYDPRHAPELWKRMEALAHRAVADAEGSQSRTMASRLKELFSTHPSHETRIEDLTRLADELMPDYTRRVDHLAQCTTEEVPSSDRLLPLAGGGPARSSFDFEDAETFQSAQLAQQSAALMVGDQAREIEGFLREVGRWDKPWGVR